MAYLQYFQTIKDFGLLLLLKVLNLEPYNLRKNLFTLRLTIPQDLFCRYQHLNPVFTVILLIKRHSCDILQLQRFRKRSQILNLGLLPVQVENSLTFVLD